MTAENHLMDLSPAQTQPETEAALIEAIDHVQLAMPPGQEDAARAFYTRVLGLREIPKPENLRARGGVWFQSETGRVTVHLGVEKDFRAAKKAHPAFLTKALHEICRRCELHDYQVVDDEPLEGFDRRYIYDCFGNRMEIMQKL
jgi:catechol 2,3-dioxygenase-like lactoylglutathione lyase family enzyme